MNENLKKISIAIVAISALLVIILLISKGLNNNFAQKKQDVQPQINYTNFTLAEERADFFPPGFPLYLPSETEYPLESYESEDDGKKSLIYSYLSPKTASEKYSAYKTALLENGYKIIKDEFQEVEEGSETLIFYDLAAEKPNAYTEIKINNANEDTIVLVIYENK